MNIHEKSIFCIHGLQGRAKKNAVNNVNPTSATQAMLAPRLLPQGFRRHLWVHAFTFHTSCHHYPEHAGDAGRGRSIAEMRQLVTNTGV
jgi:hypothetical protein